MATDIQWTDETWNPVTGCSKVSPGCAHCYAEGVANRFWATQYPAIEFCAEQPPRPRQFTDVWTHADRLDQPLRWKKPRRIFVNSMSDLFHEDVPETFILSVFSAMEKAPQHTFQILTKRAQRMREVVEWVGRKFKDCGDPFPLPNVWLGVSVENQHFADERIPLLLQTPAAVRFISAEPLLGPVDLSAALPIYTIGGVEMETWLDWVIVGGESGRDARPFDVDWARSIRRQCSNARVACFIKQLGAKPTGWWSNSLGPRVGKFKDSHGGDMAEWPEDLRVREFPASLTTEGGSQ